MTQARSRSATDATARQIARLQELGWYHSIALPDGGVIEGLQSIDRLRSRIAQFPIPEDLTGKRVLDIGAWDGWFSFEMERRGAEVVAVDSTRQARFLTARELLRSKVEYRIGDICRLTPAELGYFDIVLFFGVLYHVKHPVLALENVCALAREMACVESYVTDDGSETVPLMEFYETTELRGQFDNWVGPNVACLLAFCRTAGFARVKLESVVKERAHVTCWRKHDGGGSEPAPYLTCVENSVSRDHEFAAKADPYVAFWFENQRTDLTPANVYPEIGGYGTIAVEVHRTGANGWHANLKLPLGLDPGYYDARLRVGDSAASNTIRIPVDVPEAERVAERYNARGGLTGDVAIALVVDGKTWERYEVRVGADSCVSLWATGLPADVQRNALRVRLNGADLPATYVSQPDEKGWQQVNALLPFGMSPGDAVVQLVFGEQVSAGVGVKLVERVP